MRLEVDAAARMLHADGRSIPCSIGRLGALAAAAKKEGDGATPIGVWPVRGVLLRPDRIAPSAAIRLPWRWLRPHDGWSDDPADPAYNRPVRHPRFRSAEALWREDGLYDIIVILGHNDAPAVAGSGSAIFLHCWRDGAATEGCVALPSEELLALLPQLAPGDALTIR